MRRLGALGGPVQAGELDRGLASAIIVGSPFGEVTSPVKKAFHSKSLRVYSTRDLRGLEWASALVGVLSIGVGFAKEAGAGPGLVAALVSQGVEVAGRIVAYEVGVGVGIRSLSRGDLRGSIRLDR